MVTDPLPCHPGALGAPQPRHPGATGAFQPRHPQVSGGDDGEKEQAGACHDEGEEKQLRHPVKVAEDVKQIKVAETRVQTYETLGKKY